MKNLLVKVEMDTVPNISNSQQFSKVYTFYFIYTFYTDYSL